MTRDDISLPPQSDVERGLLLVLSPRPTQTQHAYDFVAEAIGITGPQRRATITTPKGRENAWDNLVRQARRRRLVDEGYVVDADHSEHGEWRLTEAGQERADRLRKIRAGLITPEDLGL